jgi:hypothetical protein
MKYTHFFWLALAGIVLGTAGCKDDEVPIGEPFSKIEGLTATAWVFESAAIIDESNPAGPSRDISEFYQGGEPLRLKFNRDGTFESFVGNGKNVFPANGTWVFHPDNAAPREIRVTHNGNVTRMLLAGPTRISDAQLRIRFVTKECVEADKTVKPAVGYRFVFNRDN